MSLNVEDVIQHAIYDPQARHLRYLQKRQLKGRHPVIGPPKAGQGSRVVDMNAPNSTRHDAGGLAKARQEASNARQIAVIKGKLDALRAHLKELLAKKKAQDAQSTTKSSTSSTKSASSPSKPQTAKQKQATKEALKKAQETRAREQKATPDKKPATKPAASLDQQIAQARAVIKVVEDQLRAVMAAARTQTASNSR